MLDQRFWSKVAVSTENECWEWQANKNNKGYGMFSVDSYIGKKLAHRLSYESKNGKIPAGMHIMHSCDNPACVNPMHLSAGTAKDNMADCSRKFRFGRMKLRDADVISLLRDYVAGMGRKSISMKYGISIKSVNDYTTQGARGRLHGKHGCPSAKDLLAAKNLKPGAITDAKTVLKIRKRLDDGEKGKDLAAEYGLHKATISDIKLRKIWRDI